MSLVFSLIIDQKIASTRNTVVKQITPKIASTRPVSFLTASIMVRLRLSQVWMPMANTLGTSPWWSAANPAYTSSAISATRSAGVPGTPRMSTVVTRAGSTRVAAGAAGSSRPVSGSTSCAKGSGGAASGSTRRAWFIRSIRWIRSRGATRLPLSTS